MEGDGGQRRSQWRANTPRGNFGLNRPLNGPQKALPVTLGSFWPGIGPLGPRLAPLAHNSGPTLPPPPAWPTGALRRSRHVVASEVSVEPESASLQKELSLRRLWLNSFGSVFLLEVHSALSAETCWISSLIAPSESLCWAQSLSRSRGLILSPKPIQLKDFVTITSSRPCSGCCKTRFPSMRKTLSKLQCYTMKQLSQSRLGPPENTKGIKPKRGFRMLKQLRHPPL